MRFSENDQFTPDLKAGISPPLNFDNIGFSIRSNLIFFLNEDTNILIVKFNLF